MSRPLFLGLALLAAPAVAQTIESDPLDLTNGGALDPLVACAAANDGSIFWFDEGTQSVYAYTDGTPAVQEVATAAAIDAASGVDADRCWAAAYSTTSERLYLALSTAARVDFVLSVGEDASGDLVFERLTSPATGAADGITGLAATSDSLFVAIQAFVNNPPAGGADPLEDGVYGLSLTGTDQMPAAVATLSDLALVGLTARADGTALYTASDENGAGDYRNVIVEIDLVANPAGLSIFADPFDGTAFTVPASGAQFDLMSVVAASDGADEGLFVLNNSFTYADGEEIARFALDGTGDLFASQTALLADLGRTSPGFTPSSLNVLLHDASDNRLYILNRSDFGGADEALVARAGFVTDSEALPSSEDDRLRVTPNPIAGGAAVTIELSRSADISVSVYDLLGRRVADLYAGRTTGGERLVLPLQAEALPSGLYLVRLEAGGVVTSRTVTVVR